MSYRTGMEYIDEHPEINGACLIYLWSINYDVEANGIKYRGDCDELDIEYCVVGDRGDLIGHITNYGVWDDYDILAKCRIDKYGIIRGIQTGYSYDWGAQTVTRAESVNPFNGLIYDSDDGVITDIIKKTILRQYKKENPDNPIFPKTRTLDRFALSEAIEEARSAPEV